MSTPGFAHDMAESAFADAQRRRRRLTPAAWSCDDWRTLTARLCGDPREGRSVLDREERARREPLWWAA